MTNCNKRSGLQSQIFKVIQSLIQLESFQNFYSIRIISKLSLEIYVEYFDRFCYYKIFF